MIPSNDKVIVRVDLKQKDRMEIGGIIVHTAIKWEHNYREKSPTVAVVVEGNNYVKSGDILLCHHNLYQSGSPYHLYDDLFSIPFSKVLFAKIDTNGNIEPICGNIICSEIEIESSLPLPADQKKYYKNKYEVVLVGWTKYKKSDIIFTRPYSGYNIVYNINNIEKRVTKVDSEMICGVLR